MIFTLLIISYIFFDIYMTVCEEIKLEQIKDNLEELDELFSNYENICQE